MGTLKGAKDIPHLHGLTHTDTHRPELLPLVVVGRDPVVLSWVGFVKVIGPSQSFVSGICLIPIGLVGGTGALVWVGLCACSWGTQLVGEVGTAEAMIKKPGRTISGKRGCGSWAIQQLNMGPPAWAQS